MRETSGSPGQSRSKTEGGIEALRLMMTMGNHKNRFTEQEDAQLIELVNRHGAYEWNVIAGMMKNRSAKQCRERWHAKLAPGISVRPWTQEEDRILLDRQAELGNRWSEIARFLPGRTDLVIKNRWNSRHKVRPMERGVVVPVPPPVYQPVRYWTEYAGGPTVWIPPLLVRQR